MVIFHCHIRLTTRKLIGTSILHSEVIGSWYDRGMYGMCFSLAKRRKLETNGSWLKQVLEAQLAPPPQVCNLLLALEIFYFPTEAAIGQY